MPETGRIVLIDGYAQIYRSYFAIRGLTSPDGQPTNALFGVARFMLRLDDQLPHLALRCPAHGSVRFA